MEQNLTRREARENAFLAAFSATFHPDDPQPVLLNQPESHEHPLDEFSLRILRDMEAHSEEIDDVIRANLKGLDHCPRSACQPGSSACGPG